jgi:iron complex transport system substrate-binding protein
LAKKNLQFAFIALGVFEVMKVLYFCNMQSNQEKLVAHILDQLDLNPAAIPAETYDTLISDRPQLVDIDDMISYIKRIGTDLDAIDKTVELVEKIEDETSILIHKLKFISATDRPKVLVLDQIQPLEINRSAYLQEAIKIAGGIPVTAENEADKIIVIGQGEQTFIQIPQLLNTAAIASSKAIELDQVFIMTSEQFAQIPGYNYLSELESLAEILQPKYFVYGHEGNVWLQFQLN